VINSFEETPFLSNTPPGGYLVKGLKGTPVHDKKMFIS